MAETMGGEIGLQVLQAVQALGARMGKLEPQMDKQHEWLQRLGVLEAS